MSWKDRKATRCPHKYISPYSTAHKTLWLNTNGCLQAYSLVPENFSTILSQEKLLFEPSRSLMDMLLAHVTVWHACQVKSIIPVILQYHISQPTILWLSHSSSVLTLMTSTPQNKLTSSLNKKLRNISLMSRPPTKVPLSIAWIVDPTVSKAKLGAQRY